MGKAADAKTLHHAEEMSPPSVMIVDDDSNLRALVSNFLASEGFQVVEAEDANTMRQVLNTTAIDVIVLDLMMPGEDGLSVARSLQDRGDVGIIMVSALGSEADRIAGLEVGADDYLPKPLSPRELVARIRAFLRRRQRLDRATRNTVNFSFAGWQLDAVKRVLRDPTGVIIGLSEGEFALLHVFVEQPGIVLSRDMLLELSRGDMSDAFDRAVDTQVSRLRRKLATRMEGEIIRTIRNEGYVFIPPVTRT